jgi:hypothetical protein
MHMSLLGLDEIGIWKKYADTIDPVKLKQSWYSKENWTEDKQRVELKGGEIKVTSDYVEGTPTPKMNPPSLRVNIYTTNPKARDEKAQQDGAKDWQKMAERGYMLGPEDFQNFELSEYYYIVKSEGDENTHYGRGGHHGEGGFPEQCASCCIKQQIVTDKVQPRAAKEYSHIHKGDGYAFESIEPKFDLKSDIGGKDLVGKLIGQKTCFYNVLDNKGKVKEVVMETYVDTGSIGLQKPDLSKQNWRLYAESRDNGSNWTDAENQEYVKGCNAINKDMMITWGGPAVTTRLDKSTKRIFLISLREIAHPA